MTMTLQQIEEELFNLDLHTRAKIAQKLLISLDAPNEEENLQLWVAETEHRLSGLRTGKDKEFHAEETFRKIRAALQ